jgi:hypothetical protein
MNNLLKAAKEETEALQGLSEGLDTFIGADMPIPNSWVDDEGTRHANVWETTLDQSMRIVKKGSDWVIIDTGVF